MGVSIWLSRKCCRLVVIVVGLVVLCGLFGVNWFIFGLRWLLWVIVLLCLCRKCVMVGGLFIIFSSRFVVGLLLVIIVVWYRLCMVRFLLMCCWVIGVWLIRFFVCIGMCLFRLSWLVLIW